MTTLLPCSDCSVEVAQRTVRYCWDTGRPFVEVVFPHVAYKIDIQVRYYVKHMGALALSAHIRFSVLSRPRSRGLRPRASHKAHPRN
jgi:hypothetical protein